ncbi:crossover junction endodeoxyribonuclease RuvC [Desulfosarcina cetonica]|uniref:crossover junction endodeoxyribonuclease RuvC n=1 Tax=Desulfosarcina cetonica TaxID=90730 RepID=UPI00278C4FF8|nr:crossover junction endodeoxyribonuclease RuvC [Desulfosarcina cetonica]
MIKIVGIDPGLADTGIGIVSGSGLSVHSYAYGTISTSKAQRMACRLEHIYNSMNRVLEEERPDLIVVEDVFSLEKYPKSGIVLGKVCGVLLLAGARSGIALTEVPVRQAKQILTGNGNAPSNSWNGWCVTPSVRRRPFVPFMRRMRWGWP